MLRIRKCSVCGATLCREAKSSIVSIATAPAWRRHEKTEAPDEFAAAIKKRLRD
jgi:hypothetical protein